MKKMACAIVLATGTGLALGAATLPAHAALAPAFAPSGLQIGIVSSASTGNASVSLDMSFRNGSLRSIELYVDGTRIKRKAVYSRDTHGLVKFNLDSELLTEGTHEILIKAYDSQGNSATTTAQVHIDAAELDALARFAFPRSRAMVQGIVPIQIKLDASIHNPYVSFFVDSDFLALTNYAPFSYNWDSSHVSNGAHTIGVDVYDGETLTKVKALSIQVNVNNAGGFTSVQKEIADLSQTGKATKVKPTAAPLAAALRTEARKAASLSAPKDGLSLVAPDGRINGSRQPLELNAVRVATPLAATLREMLPTAKANSAAVHGGFKAPDATQPATRYTAIAPAPKPGVLGLFATPSEFAGLTKFARGQARLAHARTPLRRMGNFAARPSFTLGGETVAVAQVAPPAFRVASLIAIPHIVRTPGTSLVGHGVVAGKGRTFQIAFDNSQIAFDVAPRITNGLPLAPFRQIFEHTGGKVEFFNRSKTVRAVNANYEIEFQVGHDTAKVNNQPLTMQTKSFIEKGRTIVPLSFVRDALNVNVRFDAASGRLFIESKAEAKDHAPEAAPESTDKK